MRHRKHTSKLNRTSEHRAAMLRNLAISLITWDRIRTTKVKATQIRPFLETLITLARENSLASKRLVVSRLGDKEAARKLWGEIAQRNAERTSGHLRIIADGPRMGDGAPMAIIEFVDAAPKSDEPTVDLKTRMKRKAHERRKAARKAGTATA